DVLLEVAGLTTGAIAFLAGHLVAIALYARNLRPLRWQADAPIAVGRLLIIPLLAFVFHADRAAAPGIALYATGLGAMAAMAWLSSFPRNWVSFGALLFAVSDLLIFARLGPLAGSIIPDLLVWPLYFGGQAMIAWGVAAALARRGGK
ncbi:lysoplasmalogenase family protein, partial [Sphingomonas sp.]|uniref:lysoplasmalogenase family protein n=1 Tax=Sphingomonas sp. TaxID=28214 RepID=UPI0035A8E407